MSFGAPNAVGDSRTGNLLPDHDLAGERPPRKPRGAQWRESKGLKSFTVNVPADLKDEFDAFLAKTGKNRNDVIAHVLRTQVLRKR